MNTLFVISTTTAYGIAFRVIVAESIDEAMNMKDHFTHTKSLVELGWNDEYNITYSHPTTDTKGIKAELL